MPSDLKQSWQMFFPASPPWRHILRQTYPERWLRVHSLPDAKRLPGGSADEAEVRRRHGAMAERMLAANDCALVLTYANGYRGEDEPATVLGFGPHVENGWLGMKTTDSELSEDLEGIAFAVAQFQYQPAVLTALALDAAYGRCAPLLVFAMQSGRVYSPYDGGADLFFESAAERDLAQAEFSDWLSLRADQL